MQAWKPALRDFKTAYSVVPGYLSEVFGRGQSFQQTQRLPRDALARQPSRLRIVVLRDARALAVGTTAIAAEDQLALMSGDESLGELGIAGKCVTS